MILTLIGPEETYEFDWTFDKDPPSVLFSGVPNKVWVKAANSANGVHRYYEQRGWWPVRKSDLRRVE